MKTKQTPFDEIHGYVTNSLSKERMLEVEKSIIENAEAEAVFHTMIFDYRQEREYIESLIGKDEEKNEKNSGSTCQNSQKGTLNRQTVTQKITTMKKFEGMNLPVNMEEVKTLVESKQDEIRQMKEAAQGSDYETYARDRLMERYGMTAVDAEEIVQHLLAGIEEFDRHFTQDLEAQQADLREYLEEQTTDLSEEERRNYLTNVLTALQMMNAETEDPEQAKSKIDELSKKNGTKSCDELIEQIEQSFGSCRIIDRIAETVAEGVDAEKVAELRGMLASDPKEQKLLTALALYEAERDDRINLAADDEQTSPKMTGAAAAAAVEMLRATAQLATGEIDKPAWMKWMKCILGGLYIVALGVASVLLAGYVAATLVLILMSFFGQGIIATLLAFALSIPVAFYITGKVSEFIYWSLEVLEKPYDFVVDHLVRFARNAWHAVKGKIAGANTAENTPVTETADAGNRTPIPTEEQETVTHSQPNLA